MQSALKDLVPTRTSNPRPFLICQRVLHRCHELIFGDVPEPSRSPYRSAPHTPSQSTSALPAYTIGVRKGPSEDGPKLVKVNPHAAPSLVGMGVILAAAGLPELAEIPGQWAITQGRRPMEDEGEGRKRVEMSKGAEAPSGRPGDTRPAAEEEKPEDESEEEEAEQRRPSIFRPTHDRRRSSGQRSSASTKLGASTAPPESTSFPVLHPAATAPSLPANPALSSPMLDLTAPVSPSSMQKGADPFSQMPLSPLPVPSSSRRTPSPGAKRNRHPFFSNPELTGAYGRRPASDRPPSAESLLARYSHDAQRQLLRSHYCRSEVRFLLLLEDISNRLLVIPKPARISSLRAELTSLNHNLPAEVCMPLWCSADHSHEEGGEKDAGSTLRQRPDVRRSSSGRSRAVAHSRVVRISPGDSVVLNSAERAPYLLHVEILHGDLDFDPDRRENRDLLKKIVITEDAKRRKKEGKEIPDGGRKTSAFGTPMPDAVPAVFSPGPEDATIEDEGDISSHRTRGASKPDQMEEMDLVEQLYGAKLSVRDQLPSLAEALPLPTAPKNKVLDAAVWDRSSEASSSRRPSFAPSTLAPGGSFQPGSPLSNGLMGAPSAGPADRSNGMDSHSDLLRPATPRSPAFNPRTPSPAPSPNTDGRKLSTSSMTIGDPSDSPSGQAKRYISLEDYSERMRTAAVMLAQLNASQMANVQEHQSAPGVMKWIPGTGWIMGRDPSSAGAAQHGVEPPAGPGQSQGGKLKLAAAQAAAIRERIMEEMNMLEEERVARMTERPEGVGINGGEMRSGVEDESIVRREINKADPSAAIFKEAWAAKKSRIRASSPWGHLANWDVISVIVKTGADLRQEQLATQLIERFSRIWKEEKSDCWVRFFRILITGETSGLVETITDAVSVHSIKKSEYARRIANGGPIGHVSLLDHFVNVRLPPCCLYLR